MVIMTQLNDPAVSRAQSSSNDEGSTSRLITDSRTPGTETIATPPWLVDSDDTVVDCGRGLSTTWNPSERRRRRDTESARCHVSVRHSTSMERSRRSSSRSSTLLANERMLSDANARRPEDESDDDVQTSMSVRGRCEQLIEQLIGR